MKRKNLTLGLLALCVSFTALGLAACGGGDDSSSEEHTVHSYVDGVCSCGETQLAYTLSDDGEYYIVAAADKDTITGKVVIPDEYEGKPVKEIKEQAFHSTKITELTIGDNVEVIRKHAIQLCEQLEKVTLGDSVATIEMGAFYECAALEAIDFPASVKSIGMNAFGKCNALKSVVA